MLNKVYLIDNYYSYEDIHKITKLNSHNFHLLSLGKYFYYQNMVKYIDSSENGHSMESLISIFKEDKPKVVIFTIDNKNYLEYIRFVRNYSNNEENIIGITNQNELKIIIENELEENKIIYFDEKNMDNYIDHLNKYFNRFNIKMQDDISINNYFQISENIVKQLGNRPIELYSSFGCASSCSFCSIAKSIVILCDSNIICDNIKILLKYGKTYFYFKNHNFLDNKELTNKIAVYLKKQVKMYDFVWSFFVNAKLMNSFDIHLFRDTNLAQIEIGMEAYSKKISKNLSVEYNYENIRKLVKNIRHIGVDSIIVNVIIGSENETDEDYERILKTMKELLNVAPGAIEPKISFLFPEYGSHLEKLSYNGNLDQIHDFNLFYNQRQNIFRNKNKSKLIYMRKYLLKKILYEMRKSIVNTSIEQRESHFSLSEYGIITLYYMNFLNKGTSIEIFKKKKHNQWRKSSEIQGEYRNYAPILVSKLMNIEKKYCIYVDPLLVPVNSNPILQISNDDFNIIQKCTGKTSIEGISKNIGVSCHEIVNKLKNYENYNCILYVKIFV
jgi:radical SAM superfamily enzyme YgiQ (UPF0313 family)